MQLNSIQRLLLLVAAALVALTALVQVYSGGHRYIVDGFDTTFELLKVPLAILGLLFLAAFGLPDKNFQIPKIWLWRPSRRTVTWTLVGAVTIGSSLSAITYLNSNPEALQRLFFVEKEEGSSEKKEESSKDDYYGYDPKKVQAFLDQEEEQKRELETSRENFRLNRASVLGENPANAGELPAELPPPAFQPVGVMWNRTNREAIAPLKLVTSSGADYYIKLTESATKRDAIAIFVNGGQTIEVEVPLGSYHLKYAAGEVWRGEEALFGPDEMTTYSIADERFDFEMKSDFVSGYTVELVLQRGGNLSTRKISAEEF